MQIPRKGKYYSINEGNAASWSKGLQEYINAKKYPGEGKSPMGLRYVGSMVADVHRTFLYGGIFLYPGSKSAPKGKVFSFSFLTLPKSSNHSKNCHQFLF